MTVLTRSLNGRENWQIGYDIEAKRLYVECPSDIVAKQFSVNDFLAQDRGKRAQETLVGLFLLMFPNTPEDADDFEE